jgi:hypothetical protein
MTKQLHPVEDLAVLYRARHFWHTPLCDRTVAETLNAFGDYTALPNEFINEFLSSMTRKVLPDCESTRIFYEPCKVQKNTAMEIIVESVTMPPKIWELYPDFKAGGRFNVSKPRLQRDGMALHTRHGDYFCLAIPEVKV